MSFIQHTPATPYFLTLRVQKQRDYQNKSAGPGNGTCYCPQSLPQSFIMTDTKKKVQKFYLRQFNLLTCLLSTVSISHIFIYTFICVSIHLFLCPVGACCPVKVCPSLCPSVSPFVVCPGQGPALVDTLLLCSLCMSLL